MDGSNLEIKSLKLEGLSLNLRRDADGKTNWDDLFSNTAVVETESDGNVVQEVEAGAPVVAALSVGGLHIVDSNFSYSDDRDDSHFALNDFNLSTGTIVLSEPFDFESQYNFVSGDDAGFVSAVSASGELALNLADNVYHLQQLELSTVNVGGTLAVEQLPVTIEGDLVVRLNEQTVDFTMSGGSVLGVPVSGEIQIDGLQEKGWLTGTLASGEFNINKVREQLNLDPLALVLSGEFETRTFNPAPWARYFGLPVGNAMHTGRIASSVRQSGQLLAFNQLNLQLDDSQITGDIEIADINAAVPPVNFALAVDQIDFDRYLATEDGKAPVETDVTEISPSVHTVIPVQLLRELTLSGEVTVDQLTVAGVTAQNAVLPILAGDGKIELKDSPTLI